MHSRSTGAIDLRRLGTVVEPQDCETFRGPPTANPNLTAPAPRNFPTGSRTCPGSGTRIQDYLVNLAKDLRPEAVQMQPWAARDLTKSARPDFHASEEPATQIACRRAFPKESMPRRCHGNSFRCRDEVVILAMKTFTHRVSPDLHGRPQAACGSEPHLARVLDRTLGWRHVGGGKQRVQWQGVAGSVRASRH